MSPFQNLPHFQVVNLYFACYGVLRPIQHVNCHVERDQLTYSHRCWADLFLHLVSAVSDNWRENTVVEIYFMISHGIYVIEMGSNSRPLA